MIPVWTGLAIAALALIAVLASVGRLRRFLELREEVRTRLQDLATVVAPAQAESKAVLDEAQPIFHELGTRMSGFARRGIAKLSIRGLGFDPSSASQRADRLFQRPSGLRHRASALARASRARPKNSECPRGCTDETRSSRPLAFRSGAGRARLGSLDVHGEPNLHHALQSAHVVRAAIEKDTRERATARRKPRKRNSPPNSRWPKCAHNWWRPAMANRRASARWPKSTRNWP